MGAVPLLIGLLLGAGGGFAFAGAGASGLFVFVAVGSEGASDAAAASGDYFLAGFGGVLEAAVHGGEFAFEFFALLEVVIEALFEGFGVGEVPFFFVGFEVFVADFEGGILRHDGEDAVEVGGYFFGCVFRCHGFGLVWCFGGGWIVLGGWKMFWDAIPKF